MCCMSRHAPRKRTMLGWRSSESSCISRKKSCFPLSASPLPLPRVSSLTATSFRRQLPAQTSPYAPAPSRSLTLKSERRIAHLYCFSSARVSSTCVPRGVRVPSSRAVSTPSVRAVSVPSVRAVPCVSRPEVRVEIAVRDESPSEKGRRKPPEGKEECTSSLTGEVPRWPRAPIACSWSVILGGVLSTLGSDGSDSTSDASPDSVSADASCVTGGMFGIGGSAEPEPTVRVPRSARECGLVQRCARRVNARATECMWREYDGMQLSRVFPRRARWSTEM